MVQFRGKIVRFKKEMVLLTVAITLFVLSSILYSYPVSNQNQTPYAIGLEEAAPAIAPFSYQTYAMSAIFFGAVLMIAASISYQRRSKQLEQILKEKL